jgi:hypothetical protein
VFRRTGPIPPAVARFVPWVCQKKNRKAKEQKTEKKQKKQKREKQREK